MKFSIRKDLGLQLLALYLLFVGPVVLASLAFDRLASQRLESDVKSTDLALARAIAQETNTSMDYALRSVRELATYPAVINADVTGMETLFRNLMSARPDVNLVYRLDSKGIMLFHYPVGPGTTVGIDFSFRDYYQKALTERQPLISKGRISPTTKQPVATAVMPIWDSEDNFQGLVATNINLQTLSDTLASIVTEHNPEDQIAILIIDGEGQVIAHHDPGFPLTKEKFRQSVVLSSVLSGHSDSLIAQDDNHEEILYSYVPVPRAGWGVIVSRPTVAAFATPQAFHKGVLIVVGVFLGIGLFFWLALSMSVIRPLERLATFSTTIGLEEDLPSKHRQMLQKMAERPDQMGHLIRSLTRMEQTIQDRLNELSTLLKTSAAVVSSLDSKTVLERILEQVEYLLDVEKCAIVALDEKQGVFRAQASRGLSQRYTEQISIDPNEPQSVTMRAIRTGEPVQISDTEKDPTYTVMRLRGQSEGYRSVLGVPLNTQHAPPSALLVYKPTPHVFTQGEINLLTSFANHAAMAIENAALYTRSDMRLKEQTRRLEALIQSMQDGLILEDLAGQVLYTNRRISELTDLTSEELSGAPVNKLMERLLARVNLDADEKEKLRQALDASANGSDRGRVEFSIRNERSQRFYRLQMFDVTDSNGMPIGRGRILRDVTASKEVDRMKSSLISTVSHELRTPLAAIKGYTTTLLADDVEWAPKTQQEFLNIISAETDRLSDLVNDLLDMSKIETGNLTVTKEECQLEELILNASNHSQPPPGERLILNLPPDLPPCHVDPRRIEVVLRNLIENASKYAEDGSSIIVSAATRAGNLVIYVEDDGPGIPPEHHEKVFESFFRGENGLSRSTPGAGIGLTISQGFVRAHGGDIWLEPRSQGTCIAFSIPLRTNDDLTYKNPEIIIP